MNITNLLEKASIDIWNRIGFAYTLNTKISETTLTENLLYTMHQYALKSGDNSFRIFESKSEKANGNDLEIFVEVETDTYLFFAVQAKKLYKNNNKYQSISHKVKSTDKYQIDLLLEYAKEKGGIALYFLYNHTDDGAEEFGCSFVEASYIVEKYYPNHKSGRWKIPTFLSLNNVSLRYRPDLSIAKPCHCLLEKSHLIATDKTNKKIQFYSDNKIEGDSNWHLIVYGDNHASPKSMEFYDTLQEYNLHEDTFEPKYRIVIEGGCKDGQYINKATS